MNNQLKYFNVLLIGIFIWGAYDIIIGNSSWGYLLGSAILIIGVNVYEHKKEINKEFEEVEIK